MIFLHSFDRYHPKFPRVFDRAYCLILCIIVDQMLATKRFSTFSPFSIYNLPHEDKRGTLKRVGAGWG
jgi:hypothetical protein